MERRLEDLIITLVLSHCVAFSLERLIKPLFPHLQLGEVGSQGFGEWPRPLLGTGQTPAVLSFPVQLGAGGWCLLLKLLRAEPCWTG